MEAPESAKTITVFVNGDSNYSGKKFVVNRKRTPTFDTLLGDVSKILIYQPLGLTAKVCKNKTSTDKGKVVDNDACRVRKHTLCDIS